MISVILPVYNAHQYLREAIDSILSQTYKDFELIIINDGSKDNSVEVIKDYDDPRIILIENDGNKGLIYTLNRGISLAKGDYIARMDADDISEKERFEFQLNYLQDYNLDLVGCVTCHIDEYGNEIIPLTNLSFAPNVITKSLNYDNCIAHPTWFGKKAIFNELGGYRKIYACEDYDFLLRALLRGYKMGICDKRLFRYRDNNEGIFRSNTFKQKLTTYYLQRNYERIFDVTQAEIDVYVGRCDIKNSSENFVKALSILDYGIQMLKKHNLQGLYFIMRSMIYSKYITYQIKNLIALQFVRKQIRI